MKRHLRELALLAVLLLVLGGCTDSKNNVFATPTPTAEDVSVGTPTSGDDPTPVPAAVVTDEDRTQAVVDQLAADIAATEPVSDPIDAIQAYDVLETRVNTDTESVTVTICSWTGDSVFDEVRNALYQVNTSDDGAVTATLIDVSRGAGDCLNTELINTALDHIDEYDVYWAGIVSDPASFDPDGPETMMLANQFAERSVDLVAAWRSDDLYFERPYLAGEGIRPQAAAEILYRRYRDDGLEILEVVVCRDMNPASGAYRDGVLIDDRRGDDDPGLHAINSYQFAISDKTLSRYELVGTSGLGWADCFRTGDWVSAANSWRPAESTFEIVPS